MNSNSFRFARTLRILSLMTAFILLAPSVSHSQDPSTGELIRSGGRTPARGGGGFDGRTRPGNAKIMVHLMSTTVKNQCLRARIPATNAIVNARDVPPAGTGLYPRLFFAYVLVTSDDAAAGIAGAQFGIQYSGGGPADGIGVDIFGWAKCTDLEFISPSPMWPNSGAGNLMTWGTNTACQTVEPGGAGTGIVAVAGYFYCTAYTDDILSITPRPADNRARVATCASEIIEVNIDVPPPSRFGSAGFGALSGYNPALVDSVPPAAVTDLAVTATTENGATLSWTAPGDDGNTGTAATYDLRYSTAAITPENFVMATTVPGEPNPAASGTSQGMAVGGLAPATTYYFALRTMDEGSGVSPMSNVASGATQPDTVPPAATTSLAITGTTESTITLSWTAPGDDGNTGTAASYDLRYSTAPITSGNFVSGIAATGEPTPAAAGSPQGMTVEGLTSSTTYYFALKSTDDGPNESGLSNVPSGTTQAETVPPAAVIDLVVTGTTTSSVTLSWTAPGDDGNSGTAAGYDLRYSTALINSGNFDSATPATGEPGPAVAGTPQAVTVGGLAPSVRYYFALKTADEVPNVSGLSNLASGIAQSTGVQWNPANDFSSVSNPAGAWSYGWSTSLGGTLNLYPQTRPWPPCPSVLHWLRPIEFPTEPLIARNEGNDLDCSGVYLPSHQVAMHPGPSGEYSVLRWTAPETGGYSVRIEFKDMDANSATTDVHVFRNSTAIFNGNVNGMSSLVTFETDVTLAAGETISLLVGDGGDDYYGDTTLIDALITLTTSAIFQDTLSGLPGVHNGSGSWGDYDSDGDLDIVFNGNSSPGLISRVYRNDGGVFALAASLTGAHGSAWGDYDNDGDLDLLLVGLTSRLYRNDPAGFNDTGASFANVNESSAAWGDCDNDGDLDVLITGASMSGPVSRIYRNDSGGFVDAAAGLTGVQDGSAVWGDYDGDSDLDILLTGVPTRVYRNDNGMFADADAGLTPLAESSAAWGDCDNDGDLDILLTGFNGVSPASLVYRNSGGTFTDIAAGLQGVRSGSGAWGDYDNDGDLDIALAGESVAGRGGFLYRNDGTSFVSVLSGLTGVDHAALAWGDYNNDGDLDLLLTGHDGVTEITRVYRNTATIPNSPPTAPSNLSVQLSGTRATFTWNAGGDAQTPASGLTYNLRIGTTPGGSQLSPAMANVPTGYRKVAQPGNANHNLEWTIDLQSMLSATTFRWSVQAVDHAFAGSPFAAEQVLALGPDLTSVVDIPNDQGGWVRIHLLRSPYDVSSESVLPINGYNVWRRADDVGSASALLMKASHLDPASLDPASGDEPKPFLPPGLEIVEWQGRRFGLPGEDQAAPIFPSGIWEITGSFFATQQPQYIYAAPTLADSTATTTFRSVFMVSAHTTTPTIWFLSSPDSGGSADNIAPGAPTGLSRVIRGAENQLSWNPSPEIDFQFFRVYRDTSSTFIPSAANLVHETSETVWTDIVSVYGLQHYKVSAVDHAGNESPPAAEISVSGVAAGVSALPFRLYPAAPNPFSPGTTIRFDTPGPADRLVLQIFDVRGRLVRTIVDGEIPAGGHAITWDGKDDNAQPAERGVYFYRLRTAGYDRTMKMVKVD